MSIIMALISTAGVNVLLVASGLAAVVNPNSPISYSPGTSVTQGAPDKYATLLGSDIPPTSTKSVTFSDSHAFGERTTQEATLLLFKSVAIPSQAKDQVMNVDLSLAVSVGEDRLIAVFTAPSDRWVHRAEPTWDLKTLHGWKMAPAPRSSLRSSISEVWAAVWQMGSDPREAGQVVIRPRFCEVPLFGPPGVYWVVEILGKVHKVDTDRTYTTKVLVFSDGELKVVGGSLAP